MQANVDLIVSTGTLGTAAAKRATSTIPIVMFNVGDPVASGLVTSLASPGGNVTGLAHADVGVNIKALDLLKQLLPGARIAVLHNPAMPLHPPLLRDLRPAAATSGVELVEFAYRGRLLDREVARLGSSQNLVVEIGQAAELVDQPLTVGHEGAGIDGFFIR